MKAWAWLLCALFLSAPGLSTAALCGLPANPGTIVAVNTGQGWYATDHHFDNVNVETMGELRVAAYTTALGHYRSTHGTGSAPVGAVLLITYRDDSYECALISSTSSSIQAEPIVGSQHTAPAGGGGGGGGGAPSQPLSYYFPLPTWEHVCDYYYSDGDLTQVACFYQIA
jgi:hypothetical protein